MGQLATAGEGGRMLGVNNNADERITREVLRFGVEKP